MENIIIQSQNHSGMVFNWKSESNINHPDKYNLIFNNTAMYLSEYEIAYLLEFTKNAINIYYNEGMCCENIIHDKRVLLETPIKNLSFIVTYDELCSLEELLDTAIHEIKISNLLSSLGINVN